MSGENSERARTLAAHELFDYLLELEQRKVHYHLVGHGHGGSVIWYALRLAEQRRVRLTRLRSWATVGTAFLHYRTHRVRSLATVLNLMLALLLAAPVWHVLRAAFAGLAGQSAQALSWAAEGGLRIPRTDSGKLVDLLAAPAAALLRWAGVPVQVTSEALLLGTWKPPAGGSLWQYISGTREGLALATAGALALFVLLNLMCFAVGLVMDTLRLRAEQRRDRALLRTYQGRWLGIWSPDDEHINHLRTTLDARLSFVPLVGSWRRGLYSDHIPLAARPYHWIVAIVFNTLVRPVLNRLVRGYIVRTAQGNNRPGATVGRVEVAPAIPHPVDQYPPIPAWLNERLVAAANAQLRESAEQLRELLATPCYSGVLDAYADRLTGRELVHTSYLEHSEILDLLVMHACWSLGKLDAAQRGGSKRELLPWLAEFKRQVGQDLAIHPGLTTSGHILSPAHNTRQMLRSKRRSSATRSAESTRV